MTNGSKPGPIEVWLRQDNMQVKCMVVYEDESTSEPDVDSLSMRGAQREMTSRLIGEGYEPAGRWKQQADGETCRQFRYKK